MSVNQIKSATQLEAKNNRDEIYKLQGQGASLVAELEELLGVEVSKITITTTSAMDGRRFAHTSVEVKV